MLRILYILQLFKQHARYIENLEKLLSFIIKNLTFANKIGYKIKDYFRGTYLFSDAMIREIIGK